MDFPRAISVAEGWSIPIRRSEVVSLTTDTATDQQTSYTLPIFCVSTLRNLAGQWASRTRRARARWGIDCSGICRSEALDASDDITTASWVGSTTVVSRRPGVQRGRRVAHNRCCCFLPSFSELASPEPVLGRSWPSLVGTSLLRSIRWATCANGRHSHSSSRRTCRHELHGQAAASVASTETLQEV